MELWWPCAAVPHPPLNVCSVVVCPHSAAERRQHAVRHGTCGLRLTQPVTSAARWCVHITPQPSLCEAVRPMRPPVQARCERFVLLPAGQPCEPIPSPQRPVLHPPPPPVRCSPRGCMRACVRVCVWLQPCAQTTAVWPRLCRVVCMRAPRLPHCLVARVAVGKDQRGQQD